MKRVITGTLLAAVVLAGVRLGPVWLIAAFIALVLVLAVHELVNVLGSTPARPWRVVVYPGALVTAGCFLMPEPQLGAVLTGVLVIACATAVLATGEPLSRLCRLMGTVFSIAYIGVTLGHLLGLLVSNLPRARETGEDLLILAIVVVYVGDTLAYYGGRAFGSHRLAPVISPAKTWEGAIAGVLGSIAGALLATFWFYRALPAGHAIAIGVLLGVAGILGDLTESLIKRAAAVKDSGALLPGHGGFLDRIDSLLFAAPILYWYHRIVLVGP
ncbi:MAG: phosphatidate cytidylyltransferase [Acidobacteria bacterium]|nr:phosphatidate cytidylyltransferase [Acidobacteriota bacterium]